MSTVLSVLQFLVSAVFVLLGVATLVQYLRHRERSRGYIAMAIGLLGLTSLMGAVPQYLGIRAPTWYSGLSIAVFLASGYGLLMFRSRFIPLSPRLRWGALGTLAVAGLFYIGVMAISPVPAPSAVPSPLQAAAVTVVVLAWSICVAEPIYRFWRASSERPAVQRGRLRALSIGYGGIVAILLFAGIGSGLARQPLAQVAIDVIALLTAPLLYIAFSPPRLLRREWMYPEEQAYRDAVRALLLFSPTRKALAEKALDWASRFVGANGGFITDADGTILASIGVSDEEVARLHAETTDPEHAELRTLQGAEPQTAVVVALPLASGSGTMAVISGPFTPFFGTEEVGRMVSFATNVTAGLDRVGFTERLAALERTKTEFLNLASHELRGPITVLRGYLSMLERGSLGEIPEKARKALPILTSKADEMNSLVEQMIEAARLEEGRLELSTRLADLREVVRQAVEMAQPLSDNRHELCFESVDVEVPVTVDVERIGTVVGNLLTNAIKYSPDGGKVVAAVSVDDHLAKVAVTDEGVGIPPDRIDRLFTRFGRIVTPETSHIPGTGLGLYLSRELARLHGGDITATSTLGEGSTFTLAVPLTEETKP